MVSFEIKKGTDDTVPSFIRNYRAIRTTLRVVVRTTVLILIVILAIAFTFRNADNQHPAYVSTLSISHLVGFAILLSDANVLIRLEIYYLERYVIQHKRKPNQPPLL